MQTLLRAAFVVSLLAAGCGNDTAKIDESKPVKEIQSTDHFSETTKKAGRRLLVFDLYADWCMPCRMLSPMLERIALEKRNKVTIYKINVDRLPALANSFRAQGIPLVVYMKQGEVVHSLVGLYPPETYVEAIDKFAQ